MKEKAIVELLWGWLSWRQDQDEAALPRISEAKKTLKKTPDYSYLRALLVEAEILGGIGDELEARHRIATARRMAENLELRYLEMEAAACLAQMGVPEVDIDRIVKSDIEREAERRGLVKEDLSILFADLRNFTSLSLTIDLAVMGEFISKFAGLIGRQIALVDGLPVRFLGDCVMAVFGIRGPVTEKELVAVRAAYQIYERFISLRDEWGQRVDSLRTIGLGFGLASGQVVAGQFGSGDLSEFSVIGDAVNLASRLQGGAEDGQLVVCSQTRESLAPSIPRTEFKKGTFKLKGLGPTPVHILNLRTASRYLHGGVLIRS